MQPLSLAPHLPEALVLYMKQLSLFDDCCGTGKALAPPPPVRPRRSARAEAVAQLRCVRRAMRKLSMVMDMELARWGVEARLYTHSLEDRIDALRPLRQELRAYLKALRARAS